MTSAAKYDDAMFIAAREGDVDAIKQLAAAGAPIDNSYSWGSPLVIACMRGNIPVIQELGELGAEVNYIDDDGDGPPLAKMAHGSPHLTDEENLDVANLLLELGADPNMQTLGEVETPLQVALKAGKIAAALRLVETDAIPFLKTYYGTDAFDYAVQFGAEDVLALLNEKYGKAAAARIYEARMAERLISSAQEGDAAGVGQVIVEGVDVNAFSVYGRDSLFHAAAQNDVSVVTLLLEHGADPNNLELEYGKSPDVMQGCQTALMSAAYGGHREAVDLLLEAGANIFAEFETAPGAVHNAYTMAQSGRQKEMMKYLKAEMKRRKAEGDL